MVKKRHEGPRMKRPCNRCGLYFSPSTKGTRICNNCHKTILKERNERVKIKNAKLKNAS